MTDEEHEMIYMAVEDLAQACDQFSHDHWNDRIVDTSMLNVLRSKLDRAYALLAGGEHA